MGHAMRTPLWTDRFAKPLIEGRAPFDFQRSGVAATPKS